jgi:hypothetical protein
VVDDFGRNGQMYRETDVENADLETVIVDLLDRQYKNPIRSFPLTPPKIGRRTCQKTSRMNCAGAASATVAFGPRQSLALHKGGGCRDEAGNDRRFMSTRPRKRRQPVPGCRRRSLLASGLAGR